MKRNVAVLFSMLLLSACGSAMEGESSEGDRDKGEYSIDDATGETNARIETPEGIATLRSGADVPVNLPDGFSLYPGAILVSNTQVSQDDSADIVLLSFQSDDSPDDVAAHYRNEAKAAGIDIQIDAMINDGHLIAGEGSDGAVFSLSTSAEEGKTVAQLTTGLRLRD